MTHAGPVGVGEVIVGDGLGEVTVGDGLGEVTVGDGLGLLVWVKQGVPNFWTPQVTTGWHVGCRTGAAVAAIPQPASSTSASRTGADRGLIMGFLSCCPHPLGYLLP
jgi:hypothetical protein